MAQIWSACPQNGTAVSFVLVGIQGVDLLLHTIDRSTMYGNIRNVSEAFCNRGSP